jgi:hypothetical protein
MFRSYSPNLRKLFTCWNYQTGLVLQLKHSKVFHSRNSLIEMQFFWEPKSSFYLRGVRFMWSSCSPMNLGMGSLSLLIVVSPFSVFVSMQRSSQANATL